MQSISNNDPSKPVTPLIMQPMNFAPVNVAPGAPGAANDQARRPAAGKDTIVHLWIQKRTGRKRLTFIQGIPESTDWTELSQKLRKEFHCNCTEIDHPKLGRCIQLSGDFREDLKKLFVKNKIVRDKKHVKVHGD